MVLELVAIAVVALLATLLTVSSREISIRPGMPKLGFVAQRPKRGFTCL